MDVESINCDAAKVYIITSDSYFFNGLKSLIYSIMPELLSTTGIVYDVECINSEKYYNFDEINMNEKNYFVMDMESMHNLNSNFVGILITTTTRRNNLIIFKSITKPFPCEVCFYKRMPIDLLKKQIRDVISEKTLPDLLNQPNSLTKQEGMVINYVLMGESMQTIARKMGINSKTVYTLRSKAYKKFGVKSIQALYYNSAKMNYL